MLDLLFSLAIYTLYAMATITIALLIQGITYRLTGFNIYKTLVRKLIIEQL